MFHVKTNLAQVVGHIDAVLSQSPATNRSAMKAVGVQVLSWGFQDFRDKSRGQEASGVQWLPITDAALVTRLARRAPWKGLQQQKRSLHGEPPMPAELRRRLPKGKSDRMNKVRAAIIHRYMKDHPDYARAVAKAKSERAKLKGKRDAMLAKEKSGHKIGVDTGRLANSLKFGQRGNHFDLSALSVTVGSHIEYAEHFDKRRPIFGGGFLTAERKKKLEDMVKRIVEKAAKEKLE